MADNSGLFKFLWPEIDDAASAEAASRLGAFAAGLVALVTAGVVTYRVFYAHLSQLGGYIDAAIFAALATGIWKMWRAAAVIALTLYVAEQVLASIRSHSMVGGILSVILTLFLVSGVRGTIQFHRFSRADVPSAAPNFHR